MDQLTKEQERALKEYRDLKMKDLRHWSRWGYRKPSPYRGAIDNNFAKLARLNLLHRARAISLTD